MRKLALLLIACCMMIVQSWAQTRTVSGRVTTENGTAIAGASITIKNARGGTASGQDGSFTLSVPAAANTLLVSYAGYNQLEVNIGGTNTVSVRLTSTNSALDEVVVTGIRNVKRTEYTGAVARVNEANIVNRPTGSFDQLLQGQVPGLLALTGSGQPGSSATIIIRGQSSIAGGNTPLYVVDGIPVEAATFQGINANDIISLDVLKDAAASALYGSRGSAGVIVVTTRRGTGTKMKLSYDAQMGVKNKPQFGFRPMTTAELLKAQEDYGKIAGGTASIPGWYYSKANPRYATLTTAQQAAADATLDSISKINTNWADYIFRNGTFSNHQISLSGGTGRTRVYSSLALYNEEGTTTRTDMNRISFRNNVDYSDDKFNFSLSSAVAYTKRNFQQSTTTNSTGNPFLAANIQTPYALVYKPDGTYATGIGTSFVGANQLDLTYYDKNYNNQIKTDFSINTAYKITKHVTAAVTAGVDYRETQATVYGSKLAYSRITSTSITGNAGFQTESLARFFSGDVRPSVSYSNVFAGKHSLTAGVYGEFIKEITKSFSGTGYGIDPRTPNTPAAITQGNATNQLYSSFSGGKSQNALASGLALATYTFENKYSITGSYRYDGSSKLPTNTRWTSFYSVGGVWTVTNESFLAKNRTINSLRLRASYGGSGNSNNFPYGDFGYLDTYGSGSYAGLTSVTVTNIGNPSLKWETTYQLNVGTDFSLVNNRVYGSFDWYNKLTKNLFVQQQLSAEGGGYLPLRNAGQLSNKGIEGSLSVDVLKTKNLTWTLNGNVGYNKNRIKNLGGNTPYTSGTSFITEGVALGSHYEVRWAGVDAATGAPLYMKADGKTVTSTWSASDKVQQFGTWEAPWKGGFGTTLNYKGLYLSVLFSWQKGSTKEDNLEYFVENPVGFLSGGYNQSSSLNFWKNPGDIATTPSPLYASNFSSKIIHDASFMRLRDVTLSYTLPRNVVGKSKILSNVKLYVQGSNLYIWTKWRGMDPEAGPTNINLSEFPNPRAFTGGLNVTF